MVERIVSSYLGLKNKNADDDEPRKATNFEKWSFIAMFFIDGITTIFGIVLLFPDVLSVMDFFKVVYFPENLDALRWILYIPN